MDFAALGIDKEHIELLKHRGIITAKPVQEECIGPILAGRDVIVQSQTGSGKTLAFLLPIMAKINAAEKQVQALIMTPTRELSLQIAKEAEYLAKSKNIGVLAVYGGKDIAGQMKKLNNAVQLVIATPGRLLEHLERRNIDLGQVKVVILDEADEMLLMGFRNEIDLVMRYLPKRRQLLCFSATMDSAVKKLAYCYQNSPQVITIAEEVVPFDKIKQQVIETPEPLKRDKLCQALDEDRPFMAIIFCRTKRRVNELEEVLKKRGYDCAKIHSDIQQNKRERILKTFRKGDLQYLIATDVAARGLDITGVTHIYNYDIPETVEGYIHRIGRTGRAGEEGGTCMFVAPKDLPMLKAIEEAIGMKIPRRRL